MSRQRQPAERLVEAVEALGVQPDGRLHPRDRLRSQPAQPELQSIARLLHPGGRLHLVYDAPDPSRLDRIQELLVDHLDQAGYRSAVATPATRGASLLTVKARRP